MESFPGILNSLNESFCPKNSPSCAAVNSTNQNVSLGAETIALGPELFVGIGNCLISEEACVTIIEPMVFAEPANAVGRIDLTRAGSEKRNRVEMTPTRIPTRTLRKREDDLLAPLRIVGQHSFGNEPRTRNPRALRNSGLHRS